MIRTKLDQIEAPNKSQNILNIAHRGARAFAPENTLPAFAKAKLFGCEMFEMDVRMTKDGEIIVYHDDHLLRCTDVIEKFPNRADAKLCTFTYRELHQLDAGSWFVREINLPIEQRQGFLQTLRDDEIAAFISHEDQIFYSSGEVKIPTLTETLALAQELELMVNIELKSPVDDPETFVTGVLNAVKALGMEQAVLISSFDHGLLTLLRQKTIRIQTAALSDLPIKAPVSYLRKLNATAYNLGLDHDYATGALLKPEKNPYLKHIAKLRKSAFAVNIWTCNDTEQMRYLLNAGVSGLISDYPNRVSKEIAAFLARSVAV